MAVYVVTGNLGDGKSLCAVDRARDYASKGRRVVSNFHLDLAPLSLRAGDALSSAVVQVIPAQPSSGDLKALGRGGEGEHDAGLLILDECATFLNSRQWNGPDRQEIISWMLHSRKLGWDLLLIVQHASALDKQIREMLVQYHVVVKRMDRVNIPLISWLIPIKLPRVHVAVVRYGREVGAMVCETWVFRGTSFFPCYETKWMSEADSNGWYCVLPANLSRWRYLKKVGLRQYLIECWNGTRRRPDRPLRPRCAPLGRLPADVRWMAARRLVALGIL